MRLTILCCIILLPLILHAQDFAINGRVVDYTTKKPVTEGRIRLYAEDYTRADTIRDKFYDTLLSEPRDTFYLIPKSTLIDSTRADSSGIFSFSSLEKGYYRVSVRIKMNVDFDDDKYKDDKYSYEYDWRDHILVDTALVHVELTPKVYCEYQMNRKLEYCPDCGKDYPIAKVIYGLSEYDRRDVNHIKTKPGEYWIGYCDIGNRFCYAKWYCFHCRKLF